MSISIIPNCCKHTSKWVEVVQVLETTARVRYTGNLHWTAPAFAQALEEYLVGIIRIVELMDLNQELPVDRITANKAI